MKSHSQIENLFVMLGVILMMIYVGIRSDSYIQSRALMRDFEALQSLSSYAGPSRSNPDFGLWSPQRVEAYRQAQLQTSASEFSDGPLAILRIPRIRLQVPVLEGTDDLTLDRAVGHVLGTAPPGGFGNTGIAGHRDGFFRGLKDIHKGDIVELETITTNSSYVVDELKIVEPSDTKVLLPKRKPSITLITCYPFYFVGSAPRRFIVHASLTRSDPLSSHFAWRYSGDQSGNNQVTSQ